MIFSLISLKLFPKTEKNNTMLEMYKWPYLIIVYNFKCREIREKMIKY